jgi:hypothetical protein
MAECGQMPVSFLEMLASTLKKDEEGNTFFNVICYEVDCADMDPILECGEPINNLEAYIVKNGFGVDTCGNPAIKLRICVEADAENRQQG